MKIDFRPNCYKHGFYTGSVCMGCSVDRYFEEQRRWEEYYRRQAEERRRMIDIGFFSGRR